MATFKARARALDMLGRQQIAGLPTAISELFKNAHDAYADRAEIDYYRSDGLFVLRDDGLGMTEKEFTQRWLTLGTESKMRSRGVVPPPKDPRKKVRPMLGEKGVGRLAIAIIGPQVLVLTRAKREDGLHDVVAAFIHWGLFECAGVDLDQIEIPVRTFPSGTLPSHRDLRDMVDVFRHNISKLSEILPEETVKDILTDLDVFDLDPQEIDGYIPEFSLTGNGHGTHFLIKPASELLKDDIDISNDEGASNLIRMLGGFTNTMTPDHEPPVIRTAFRDHKTDDYGESIIDPERFFTPQEFENADHRFCGTFDEYGQFKGTVTVYGKKYPDYIVSWKGGRGLPSFCGPFTIDVANVQGVKADSLLPLQEWTDLISKMNAYGGLYIYRDGIRILPYGNTDYDWLDIEKNRSKSANYYFFSYRRIFGVVTITHERNGNLIEKAGREGFRENEAYRQFKGIIKNFFLQLAADFFRKDSPDTFFAEMKSALTRQDELRKKREKQVSIKRSQLKEDLGLFFKKYEEKAPHKDAEFLIEETNRELKEARQLTDTYNASEAFLRIESDSQKKMAELEERYRIIRPKGLALPKYLQKDWEAYTVLFVELRQTVFIPAQRKIEEMVGELARTARIALDRRLRIERSLITLSDETKKVTNQEKKATEERIGSVQRDVISVAKESGRRIRRVLEEVAADFARMDVTRMDDAAVVKAREEFEARLLKTRKEECDLLQSIREQLDSIDLSGEGGLLDQMEAVEQRALALEEQAGLDLQLTQLGMAIEVINHEFDSSIRAVRQNLRRLRSWADVNPSLEDLYQSIRNSFEHLDGYLTLFTPLHRRLYRKEIVMSGADIYKFLSDLFRERFKRHSVTLIGTPSFMKTEIVGYPSSFYPVFVNLVDNAVFWLKDRPERIITLNALDGTLIVKDTGPGIPKRDRESVFELGFSRKPAGRGMGLHISKEVLNKIDYDLVLQNSDEGTEFHIRPRQ